MVREALLITVLVVLLAGCGSSEATWTTYTTDDGLADNDVRAIAVAADGAVWFGTESGGVSRFDGKEWTTYTGVEYDFWPYYPIDSIAVAPDGTLWFGGFFSDYLGPSCFDGERWITYTEDDGWPGDAITAIAATSRGTVWVGTWRLDISGTEASGVCRFDPASSEAGEWTTFTTEDGGGRRQQSEGNDRKADDWAHCTLRVRQGVERGDHRQDHRGRH